MNYLQYGFRFFYHCFAVFDKEVIAEYRDDFKRYDRADLVLVYGYIDHEHGFSFDVLALSCMKDGRIEAIELRPENKRIILRARDVAEEDVSVIENDAQFKEYFARYISDIAENHEQNEGILETRDMAFLDDLRDPYNIDDVEAYLFKEGLDPEISHIRIEGHGEHYLIGVLLEEPEQNFDYHKGEEVVFAMKRTQDETWMAICDLNPTKTLKRSDLEGGILLKEAIAAFARERNQANLLEVLELLRDSTVIIPCNAVFSQDDQNNIEKIIEEADDDPESLTGKTIVNKDQIRLVPDILENEGNYYFPVFSDSEVMGEYGEHFSHVEAPFLSAITLARNADKKLSGIVVNAFSEAFILDDDLINAVTRLKTRIVEDD